MQKDWFLTSSPNHMIIHFIASLFLLLFNQQVNIITYWKYIPFWEYLLKTWLYYICVKYILYFGTLLRWTKDGRLSFFWFVLQEKHPKYKHNSLKSYSNENTYTGRSVWKTGFAPPLDSNLHRINLEHRLKSRKLSPIIQNFFSILVMKFDIALADNFLKLQTWWWNRMWHGILCVCFYLSSAMKSQS